MRAVNVVRASCRARVQLLPTYQTAVAPENVSGSGKGINRHGRAPLLLPLGSHQLMCAVARWRTESQCRGGHLEGQNFALPLFEFGGPITARSTGAPQDNPLRGRPSPAIVCIGGTSGSTPPGELE